METTMHFSKKLHNVSRAVTITNNPTSSMICYAPMMITTNGIWQGTNPMRFSLPLFIMQMTVIVLVTRVLVVLLKPFRQPRVIAEIVAGILLGPSIFGRVGQLSSILFPQQSLLTLETVAHLGLVYFLFLIGVEMDVVIIRRCGKKGVFIAAAGMILPFAIGTSTAFIFQSQISKNIKSLPFLLFMGVALSVTAFPVLARILAEIKLLNCDLGRIAMSAAIVNDMCSWILLALSIAVTDAKASPLSSLYVLLSGVVFVLICFFVVRPIMWWVSRQIREGETAKDSHVCLILAGVLLAGIITDAIGIHSVFGSFVYGLVIPNGPLSIALIEKLEDFITGMLLPLFFAISGLRTNIAKLNDFVTVGLLVFVFALASVGKIAGTLLVAAFYNMPFREGLALGFLMNTRGLIEMIILNIGRDKEVLDDESFATMVLVSVTLTALVTPIVTSVRRSSRLRVGYKRRNLQLAKPDSELRLLVCVHTPRNVTSIISLLDISNPTKRAPTFTYALHLVELTSRASNMLIVHNSAGINKTLSSASTSATASSPHIFTPFETYEQQVGGVSVQQMTTVSPYSTMHEDVCNLTEDRHVSLIVLPFHKQQTVDGSMEPINPSIKSLNENILETAPCSVAIFVDRGLSSTTARLSTTRHVAVLFFGGPDDREALSFATRMVGNVNITLTVVRFVLAEGQESACAWSSSSAPDQIAIAMDEIIYQRALDDECLHEFLIRTRGNNSISYIEKVVHNSEEAVGAIQNMDSMHEFYIVGRGYKESSGSTLTETLKQWTECPELGPIGDMLVSSDFSRVVSVLVVQQYVSDGPPSILAPAPPPGFGRDIENNNNNQFVQQYLSNANSRMASGPGAQRGSVSAFNVGWNG